MNNKDYIHFYGSDNLNLFHIERKAMDKKGLVVSRLNEILPMGKIVDIGAGNGFTAAKLMKGRKITCVEPSTTLPDFSIPVEWVKGTAEQMPFHDGTFDAGYSTWAYFLPGVDKFKGLAEVSRVIKKGGKLVIVDNAGDDEFCSFSDAIIHSDMDFYLNHGFQGEIVETAFEFDNLHEAQALMGAFFGADKMKSSIKLKYEYRVIIYQKTIGQ